MKVVSDEQGPDPRTHYVLVPTVAQTNPERASLVVELLAQENSKWHPFPTVTYEWVLDGVRAGSLQRTTSDDPDRDRIVPILEELAALEEMHSSLTEEVSCGTVIEANR